MNFARCLEDLDEAIAAATTLAIDTRAAMAVRDTARERARFPGEAYVLALVGGTGVGKSTLLNALAGDEISPASARRPTTSEPVAWVPAPRRDELAELMAWLGVTRLREHRVDDLKDVAILDLPDVDSITAEHRAKVDQVLPRVDAVAWVVDPQKYADDVAHSAYLREWGPRIARQVVVLNRADLLSRADAERVSGDLRARLARDGLNGTSVVVAQANAGPAGIADVRRWLESGVDAKRIVTERFGASALDAARTLARAAGVDGDHGPLLDPARRERALSDVTRGALEVIDIRGLHRQAVAATRLAARPRGAGPLGHVTSLVYRVTGRARAAADPAGYLRRWQSRGSLAPALEPLRELVATALPSMPPALRAQVAELSAPNAMEARLVDAIDRSVSAEASQFTAPTSAVWSVIGLGQYIVTAVLIFAALWFASLFVLHEPATGSVLVPVLGPVPAPVVLLAAALLVGYILANLLRLHAGWLGRRWARRVSAAITREVTARVDDEILLPIERLDAARGQLARAVRALDEECGKRI